LKESPGLDLMELNKKHSWQAKLKDREDQEWELEKLGEELKAFNKNKSK